MGGPTVIAVDNWAKLAPLANNGGSLYLDRDSIKRNVDGTVCATTRDTYDASRRLSNSKTYQYDTHMSVHSCKEG